MSGLAGGLNRNFNGSLSRVLALSQADLIADLRKASATSFYSANASTVQTVLLPAANVNGVIIVSAGLIGNSGAPAALFHDTAAPTAWDDVTKFAFLMAPTNVGVLLELPFLIQAGRGIYHAGNALARLAYRIL